MDAPTWIDSLMALWGVLRGLGTDWPRHFAYSACVGFSVSYPIWITCRILYGKCFQSSTRTSLTSVAGFCIDLACGLLGCSLAWWQHLRLDSLV